MHWSSSNTRTTVVWCGTTYQLSRRERLRPYKLNAGMRIILETPSTVTGTKMRQKLDWITLAQRRKLHIPRRFTGASTEQGLHASTTSFSDLSDGQTRGSSSGKFTFTTLKQIFRVCQLCSFNVTTFFFFFFFFWGGGTPTVWYTYTF